MVKTHTKNVEYAVLRIISFSGFIENAVIAAARILLYRKAIFIMEMNGVWINR